MLYKLYMSVVKEILLLRRDLGGVIILFVMPLVLIITVTLIQDNSFKKVSDAKIPILLVNNDNGKVSESVFENLEKSNAFSVFSLTILIDNGITIKNMANNVQAGTLC